MLPFSSTAFTVNADAVVPSEMYMGRSGPVAGNRPAGRTITVTVKRLLSIVVAICHGAFNRDVYHALGGSFVMTNVRLGLRLRVRTFRGPSHSDQCFGLCSWVIVRGTCHSCYPGRPQLDRRSVELLPLDRLTDRVSDVRSFFRVVQRAVAGRFGRCVKGCPGRQLAKSRFDGCGLTYRLTPSSSPRRKAVGRSDAGPYTTSDGASDLIHGRPIQALTVSPGDARFVVTVPQSALCCPSDHVERSG